VSKQQILLLDMNRDIEGSDIFFFFFFFYKLDSSFLTNWIVEKSNNQPLKVRYDVL
jgi:hypothetical protein